jgi:hypothetical protein
LYSNALWRGLLTRNNLATPAGLQKLSAVPENVSYPQHEQEPQVAFVKVTPYISALALPFRPDIDVL